MKLPRAPTPSDNTGPQDAPPVSKEKVDNEATGVPWFRTWRRVYLFVLGVFILWVSLLTALTMIFT